MSVWKSDETLLSIFILNFSFKNDFVWEEISNIRHSVSSPDETPRSSSKILRCASHFQLSSRCFIWWWNTASHVWYITSTTNYSLVYRATPVEILQSKKIVEPGNTELSSLKVKVTGNIYLLVQVTESLWTFDAHFVWKAILPIYFDISLTSLTKVVRKRQHLIKMKLFLYNQKMVLNQFNRDMQKPRPSGLLWENRFHFTQRGLWKLKALFLIESFA